MKFICFLDSLINSILDDLDVVELLNTLCEVVALLKVEICNLKIIRLRGSCVSHREWWGCVDEKSIILEVLVYFYKILKFFI